MATESTKSSGMIYALRTVQGPTCAECREPIGVLLVNDKTVLVESRMVQLGDTLVFAVHRCSAPVLEPKPRRRSR